MRSAVEGDRVETMRDTAANLRVGGQALVDGVLMRSPRAWAVARIDGTIEVGPVTPTPLSRVPVLRVLASLLPALALGLKAMAGGARRKATPVLALLLASTLLGPLLPSSPSPLQSLALAAGTIALLRLLGPKSLWRFHGAEHKAVAAYEAGTDLGDVDSVLAASRVHPRCGTNLVALVVVPTAFLTHFAAPVQIVAALALVGAAAELLTVSARRPRSVVTWAILAPGLLLQRFATTAEPTPGEQEVACRALAACLAEHHRLTTPSEDLAPAA